MIKRKHRYEPDRDDELANCEVCFGAEGSLPTDCPGEPMTGEQQDAVYAGTLDFIDGEWIIQEKS